MACFCKTVALLGENMSDASASTSRTAASANEIHSAPHKNILIRTDDERAETCTQCNDRNIAQPGRRAYNCLRTRTKNMRISHTNLQNFDKS